MKKISSTQKICIENVSIWNANATLAEQDVFLEDGVVTKIVPTGSLTTDGFDCLNGEDAALIPAGVDPQVHLRVPGQEEKETPSTGLMAAAHGGIACLLTMPNTKPVIDDLESYQQARDLLTEAAQQTGVEVLISAAITKGQKGKEPVDFAALAKAGVVAFTDDGLGVVADQCMEAAFAASQEWGLPILQHAEMPGHGGVLAYGPLQEKMGMKAYPDWAEYEMVARDLSILKKFPGARYHVLHVSSAKTLEVVAEFKEAFARDPAHQKTQVTCEVSPHHLLFTASDIDSRNKAFKMNPPLRSFEDRSALREGLVSAVVDFVATDHAPHEKEVKDTSFATSAYGTVGLETSLRTLLQLRLEGVLTEQQVVAAFSTKPAAFLGVDNRYGKIEEGKACYAVLVDPEKREVFKESEIMSLSKNSCFIGRELGGELRAVFLGKVQWGSPDA